MNVQTEEIPAQLTFTTEEIRTFAPEGNMYSQNNVDFGLMASPSKVSGNVFLDENGNGLRGTAVATAVPGRELEEKGIANAAGNDLAESHRKSS